MTVLQFCLIHAKILALASLALYVMLVLRNAVVLFVIPYCQSCLWWLRTHQQLRAARSASPLSMPGRTKPLNDFFEMLHDRETEPNRDIDSLSAFTLTRASRAT